MLTINLLAKIYEFVDNKINMLIVFPQLKNNIKYKCDFCLKDAYFIVKYKHFDSCNDCKNHYTIGNEYFVCNVNCKECYYEYNNYKIIKINNNLSIIKALASCEKDDCYHCGRRIWCSEVQYFGIQIKDLPPKPPKYVKDTMLSENVKLFIKKKLDEDNTSNINKGQNCFYKFFFLYQKRFHIKVNFIEIYLMNFVKL
jgi:hypothetical protein